MSAIDAFHQRLRDDGALLINRTSPAGRAAAVLALRAGIAILEDQLTRISGRGTSEPAIRLIDALVARRFGVPVNSLRVIRRHEPRFFVPRQVAMCMLHRCTSTSLKQIATAYGLHDHTTVRHAIAMTAARASAGRLPFDLADLEREIGDALEREDALALGLAS